MFRLQKVSNYGTGSPAVARTFTQGCEILRWFQCEPQKIEQAKAVLLELQRQAVRCTEKRDLLSTEYEKSIEEAQALQSKQPFGDRTIVLPGVGDLQSHAESFLQAAKLAIAATGNLVEPFYQKEFGHNYQKFGNWAAATFGKDSQFSEVISSWEPFVKAIVNMRNAVDHPRDGPGGRLIVTNFELAPGATNVGDIRPPQWSLSGDAPAPLLESMDQIIEHIIVLGEMVIIQLLHEFKGTFPVEIKEIPIERREPGNVRRLEVGLA